MGWVTGRRSEEFLEFSELRDEGRQDGQTRIEQLEEEIVKEKQKQMKLNRTLTLSVETYKKLEQLLKLKDKNDKLLDLFLKRV